MTSYIITQKKSLRLLADAGIGWKDRIISLPSWVPDYQLTKRPCTRLANPASRPHYKAGGDHAPIARVDTLSNDLIVQGRLIDTVNKLSSSHPYNPKDANFIMKDYLGEILGLFEASGLDPEDPTVRECLWRTLLGDRRTTDGEILSPEYGEWFKSMIDFYTNAGYYMEVNYEELDPTKDRDREVIKSSQQSHRYLSEMIVVLS